MTQSYFSTTFYQIVATAFLLCCGLLVHAQEIPFGCDYNAYLYQKNDVFAVDLASGNAYQVATDITPGNINGAAYNPADGYMWGSLSTPDQAIVRIGVDFETTTYIIESFPSSNPYIGGISAQGIYYAKPGGTTFYKVDLNPASASYLQMIGTGTLSQNINIHDWAFNSTDNQLYTVEKGSNHLFKINPDNGIVSDLGEVPILSGVNYTFGAVYFDASGNFYVSANQTGTVYIINNAQAISNGNISSNLFAYGPSSSSNDGARCPTAPVPQENCTNGIDDDGDGLVDCDDPACSGVSSCPELPTSGGFDGGLESNNRLADLILKRNYQRTKNNTTFNKHSAPLYLASANQERPTDINFRNTIRLNDFIPSDVFENAIALESSPTDLLNITNASEVFSVDYYENDTRIGALLALKTEDKVYEHSKYICDRLLGAELLSVATIEINEQQFIRSIIKRPDGQTDFAISFSARMENDSFIIESHWNIDKYPAQTDYYNFQIWTSSMDQLYQLSQRVLQLLAAHQPIAAYHSSPAPAVFVKRGTYQQGKLILEIQNLQGFESVELEGGLRTTEDGATSDFTSLIELDQNDNRIQLETGPIFDLGFRIQADDVITPDDLFFSDGPWGIDDNAASTSVETFTISQNESTYTGSGYPVERGVNLRATTTEYVSVYRTFNPRFTAVDLSAYNTLSFEASGTGVLEITLVKESIEEWEQQFRSAVQLSETKQTFKVRDFHFASSQAQDLDLSDVKMIVFSLNADGGTETKELELGNLEFFADEQVSTAKPTTNGTSTILPNPMITEAQIYWSCANAGHFDLSIHDQRGAVVHQQSGQSIKGFNQINLDRKQLINGFYFYTITTSNYESFSGKFIVQD